MISILCYLNRDLCKFSDLLLIARFKVGICMLALLLMLSFSFSVSASDPLKPPTLGEVIGGQVADLKSAFERLQSETAAYSDSIQDARIDYWRARLQRDSTEQIEDKYYNILLHKDFSYLIKLLSLGPNSINSGVDGGVNLNSRNLFIGWANAVKSNLNGQHQGWTYVYNPAELPRAIGKSADAYKIYLKSRSYGEMVRSIELLYEYVTHKDMLRVVFMDALMTGPMIGYDPVSEETALQYFDIIYSILKEEEVEQLLNRVELKHSRQILYHAGISFFRAVGDTPLGYIIDVSGPIGGARRASYSSTNLPHIARAFKNGVETYLRLRETYGETQLIASAKEVMNAPKDRYGYVQASDGRVKPPKWWVEYLLQTNSSKI